MTFDAAPAAFPLSAFRFPLYPHPVRNVWLFGLSLALLLGGMVLAWNHRYQALAEPGAVTLEHLTGASSSSEGVDWHGEGEQLSVSLSKTQGVAGPSIGLSLAGQPACDAIHLTYRLQAKRLLSGKRPLQDGGISLIWSGPDERTLQRVGSTVGDLQVHMESLICPAPAGSDKVDLQIDHRGLAGEFELSEFELVLLRQRDWWNPVLAMTLVAGWIWGVLALRHISGVCLARSCLASAVLLGAFLLIAVPGPWLLKKPLVSQQFAIGESPVATMEELAAGNTLQRKETGQTQSELHARDHEIIQDNWVLWLKRTFKSVKSLFHAAFFAGLAFLLSALMGQRNAWISCALLALASELAQVAFRYGVGLDELGDLAMNALGILFGCLLYRRVRLLAGWWNHRRQQRPG